LAEGDGAASLDSIDAALGEEERALLQLRYRDGLSVDAIARSLGAAPRRIESALRRALAKVRKTASAADVRKPDANRRTP
jgi:RNA polymerase sigma factor (sigma-70 family)